MFSTEIVVTVDYLNYGNHVGYDSYFSIAQEARMRWLKLYNMSELNLDASIGYIVIKASMNYKAEAFYGDILIIEVSCANQQDKKFDFLYKIKNKMTEKLIAFGETTQVFFDYNLKKISLVPNKFSEKIYERKSYLKQEYEEVHRTVSAQSKLDF